MNINLISDQDLRSEFIQRFTLKRGAKIDGSEKAARHFQTLLLNNDSQEQFLVLYLTNRNEIITEELLFRGSISTSVVYPRELVKRALKVNSSALVIAHNHPSGSLFPSIEDQTITKRLKQAVELMNITLYDHIIVGYGRQDYYSFADHGLL